MVWRSTDEGKSWDEVRESKGKATHLIHHPFDKEHRAVILSSGTEHWYTTDKGSTWTSFSTPLKPSSKGKVAFHAKQPDYMLITVEECDSEGWFAHCHEKTYYTKNGFRTSALLLDYTYDCAWAKNSADFEYSSDHGIFCLQWPDFMRKPDAPRSDTSKLRFVKSDDYFPDGKGEVVNRGGGVVAMGTAKGFLVLAVKTSADTLEMHVSRDGKIFVKGKFPLAQGLNQEAYTILDSSSARLAVDVLAAKSTTFFDPPYGHLFFSNSDGSYFVQTLNHTNRAKNGRVDFERIQAREFESIIFANVVDNWKDLDDSWSDETKKLVTRMSWNDGGTWEALEPPADKRRECSSTNRDNCKLHLHSVTETHNIGRVLSATAAPGILIGVGSVGSYLKPYSQCDTYLSRDAGKTWRMLRSGPHKYESLDAGGLIALFPDGGETSEFYYSWDQGNSWEKQEVQLDKTARFKVHMTTLDPDSTSRKMLMLVMDAADSNVHYMVQLDFATLDKRKCNFDESKPDRSDDFELFKFGKDAGSGTCVMGKEVAYYRRSENANCYVGQKFNTRAPTVNKCKCTKEDWECDTGYAPQPNTSGKLVCEKVDATSDQPLDCKLGSTYDGRTGYRKIPGSACENGVYHEKEEVKNCQKVDRKPGGVVSAPDGNEPSTLTTVFGSEVNQIVYFRKSSVVLIRTDHGALWRSDDEGKNWKRVLEDKTILKMILHETAEKRAYFLTEDDILWTDDALTTDSVEKLRTPVQFNELGLSILDFHPTKPDWLVFLGQATKCPASPARDCHTETHISKDHGESWIKVETWANKCVWGRDKKFDDKEVEVDSVYCMSWKYKTNDVGQDDLLNYPDGSNTLQLVEINGNNKTYPVEEGVMAFYVVENVMVVAVETSGGLKLLVSTNGEKYVEAKFPPNLKLEKNSFTVLESTTGGIFLDVSQSGSRTKDYGILFKSNYNGTYYSKVLEFTNRQSGGEVDFEKIQGINGIILANNVSNAATIGSSKPVTSVMSFDDGATWKFIEAPNTDAKGGKIDCRISDQCGLHLHSHGATYLAASLTSLHTAKHAPGFVIGVGNVGTRLKNYNDGNVYISRDAGRTWMEVIQDAHKWAIGDHGGVIVLVNDERETDELYYSWNFGLSWAKYKFTDRPLRVKDIHTHPTATSLKFIISGSYPRNPTGWEWLWGDEGDSVVLVNVDFEALLQRKCKSEDFEKWSLDDGGQSRCFLGHKPTFKRRKQDAVCYVGEDFEDEKPEVEICACEAADFECDFNFFRASDGTCQLYGGHDPLEPANCKEGEEYWGSSGYRKIAISQCKGGEDLSKTVKRICGKDKGHESTGPIKMSAKLFDSKLDDYFYFNQSSTLVMKDKADKVHISQDNGKTWEIKLEDVPRVFQDPFRGERAYFIGAGEKVKWTEDRGKSFKEMKVPTKPANWIVASNILKTHGTEKDSLIWIGQPAGCSQLNEADCHTEAYYSTNHGGSWKLLTKWADQCFWADNGKFKIGSRRAVFCLLLSKKDGDQRYNTDPGVRELWKSENAEKGEGGFSKVREDVVKNGIALFEEFMVAAVRRSVTSSREGLDLYVTIDGSTWAEAKFPKGYSVTDHGYTVLESTTGSIFLDMFMSSTSGKEYGTLLISNGNGTEYSVGLEYTNQDTNGYVDFEKIQGLEGIALVNQISNYESVKYGSSKKLVTKMSWDDGKKWSLLTPPDRDSNGNSYDCRESGCNLHIHSYTERRDKRDQFTSSGAVGLIMGVGNVGASLGGYTDGDVFISRDAGRTWTEVAKDAHRYEFGDQGALILLINDEGPTDSIKYTKNQGKSFHDYRIADAVGGKIRVQYLISEPSGTTSQFVIFGTVSDGANKGKTAAISLDFEGIWDGKKCEQKDDEASSDFEKWSPAVSNDHCRFGKEITYHRRKADRECYVDGLYQTPKVVEKPCACTKDDFECDTNYASNDEGKCVLVAGFTEPEPWCDEVEGIKRRRTGYRKLKISDCRGGEELDKGEALGYCTTKPVSIGAGIGYAFLSIGLAGLVSFGFWKYKERFGLGRIRLPVDTIETTRAGTASFVESAVVVLTDLGERILSLSRAGVDWVKGKLRRGAGYAPVDGEAGGIVWEDEDAEDY
ncbi:vacuolar protein sorting/targeting protein PEP1 [Rhizophlyctis rosea]|uniref:Vacuolar protein sorting/targeting protein PEP1 n=1 Tax=Rhizophlyctis rosea TaxID=64517 RepID=A0AAD5SFT6_9FUNG|nr:vacuolar protein sorting/targeting protein PEP1 [Rhizophlyctis rosea]